MIAAMLLLVVVVSIALLASGHGMIAAPLPTRAQLPPEAGGEPGGPPLEYVHWPLYSAVALDAAALPSRVAAFNYVPGSTVSGAGVAAVAATKMHTNMAAVGTIPRPKTFVVTAIRLLLSPLEYTATSSALADDTAGTTLENSDQVDDAILVVNSMAFRFRLGEITLAEAPLWLCPANAGIGGVAATSISNTNAASAWQTRTALHTAGLGYTFATGRKPVLWSSQQFTFEYLSQWTTNPTLVGAKLLYAVLDGVMGRELQ